MHDREQIIATNETNNGLLHMENGRCIIYLTKNEIIAAIDEMKPHSACPQSGIPAQVFKKCKLTLSLPLKLFWQKSFSAGEVPSDYKFSQIIPLHKKGSKNNPENYRGITLLSVIGKLFTRVLNNRLVK